MLEHTITFIVAFLAVVLAIYLLTACCIFGFISLSAWSYRAYSITNAQRRGDNYHSI